MKARYLTAAALAIAVAAAAGCSSSTKNSSKQGAGKAGGSQSITVWLQVDAQQSWPQVVAAATADFQQKHPGVKVNVEYQQWPDHLTKLDAVLAGSSVPDVVEFGNTETTKYMASGALLDLSADKSSFDGSTGWLPGLSDSCTFEGKTYCVPYYAGARAVIYRKDLFAQAGIKNLPSSLDELIADGQKLMAAHRNDPNFSAFYLPGKYWYASMTFVYDFGGKIAEQSGSKWSGTLNSAAAQQGLAAVKRISDTLSRADRTGDEAKQDAAFAQGHIAMILANGWEWGVIIDPKAGNPKLAADIGAFPLPSHVAGQTAPVFLGGSDLAVLAKSKHQDLAKDWIRAFTSNKNETALATQGKVIANVTSLANVNAANPQLAPFALAAKTSWFVPTAVNWANVESANIIPDMLVKILTNKASIADASKAASDQITTTLNAS